MSGFFLFKGILMNYSSSEFHAFLHENCNRADFIQNWLFSKGVKSNRLCINGRNHILVQYANSSYDLAYRIKTVVSHHDRVPGSMGANDNSACVWMLMNWAVYLKDCGFAHNVRILFTDGEELGAVYGVREQGAYILADTFRRLRLFNDDVFVFDSCGRGTIPVLADTILPDKVGDSFKQRFDELFRRTRVLLNDASGGKFTKLPVPYSDNASFLSCGIPCVAITMLPVEEAKLYYKNLLTNPLLAKVVFNRRNGMEFERSLKKLLPLTWQMFHTLHDNISSLQEESIPVMGEILSSLASLKTPSLHP